MLRLHNGKMKLTLILLQNRFLGPCPVLERGKLFAKSFSCGRLLDCTGCSHIWLFSKVIFIVWSSGYCHIFRGMYSVMQSLSRTRFLFVLRPQKLIEVAKHSLKCNLHCHAGRSCILRSHKSVMMYVRQSKTDFGPETSKQGFLVPAVIVARYNRLGLGLGAGVFPNRCFPRIFEQVRDP